MLHLSVKDGTVGCTVKLYLFRAHSEIFETEKSVSSSDAGTVSRWVLGLARRVCVGDGLAGNVKGSDEPRSYLFVETAGGEPGCSDVTSL